MSAMISNEPFAPQVLITTTSNDPGAPMTFENFAQEMMRDYQGRGAGRATICDVRTVLHMLKNDVGLRFVTELENDDIGHRFSDINPYKYPRRRTIDAFFCAIIRRGKKLGFLRSLPTLQVVPSCHEYPGREPFSPEEADVKCLLTYLQSAVDTWTGRRLYTLAMTIVLTGIEVEQALNLKVSNIDLTGRKILGIRRKVRMGWTQPTFVGIDDNLAAILAMWIPCLTCEWLFPGVKQIGAWRTGFYTSTCYGDLKAACRAAGTAKQITFKQLRRYHFDHAVRIPPSIVPARVILKGPNEAPIVDGQTVPLLSPKSWYEVVETLVRAAPKRLPQRELVTKSGYRDARRILGKIAKSHPAWESVILMAGKPGEGYGILV